MIQWSLDNNWIIMIQIGSNLISHSSAFSKTSLNIWKSMVHVLLKPGLENFEHYFTNVCYAKSLQSCLTLCDPMDCSPTGSPVPGILQARILEWFAISFSNAWKWKVKEVTQSCPTLSNPMDSSVHGIFQARILEWVAISFSRGSSRPMDRTRVSGIVGRHFTIWATG